jgi:hypothetical protein
MLRDRKFFLCVLSTLFLAGGIFGLSMESRVQAAPYQKPALQGAVTDTPSDTLATTPTDTPTPTQSLSAVPSDTPTATDTLTPVLTLPSTDTPSPTNASGSTRTRTPTRTRTSTRTRTPTRTPTLSPTITNTGTLPTPTPSAPHHIVISEFQTTGPLGSDDEFVEIYNPTGAPVNIGNWWISKSSGCGTSIVTVMYIYYGTILQPGQHYLAASFASYSSVTNADQRFSPGIADNGGLALFSYSGAVVDQAGMCTGTYYHEGKPLPPLPVAPPTGTPTPIPGISYQSYERRPGGDTSCYDTNDNFNDFILRPISKPQNQASGINLCAGVALTTPTRTPTITITFTRTPTRVPTAIPAVVVLNEFLPHPQLDWNGDGVANVGDEYIELINVSPNSFNVKGWKLDTGVNSLKSYTLPDLTLQPRQITVFYGSETGMSLSDGGGTVRLIRTDGRIIDAFTYPVVELPERTWCRLPDGSAQWGFNCRSTPGQPNISVNASSAGTVATPGAGSNCPQGNVAPGPLVLAECGNFGAGIINNLAEGEFWLQSRLKWGVFLE